MADKFKKGIRKLKNQAYEEEVRRVRDATSNEKWRPSSTEMALIAKDTYESTKCDNVLEMLFKRLLDLDQIQHVSKSLSLLEYLLRNGSDRFVAFVRDNREKVSKLKRYRFLTGKVPAEEIGGDVRKKADQVFELLNDSQKLREERARAGRLKDKIKGTSNLDVTNSHSNYSQARQHESPFAPQPPQDKKPSPRASEKPSKEKEDFEPSSVSNSTEFETESDDSEAEMQTAQTQPKPPPKQKSKSKPRRKSKSKPAKKSRSVASGSQPQTKQKKRNSFRNSPPLQKAMSFDDFDFGLPEGQSQPDKEFEQGGPGSADFDDFFPESPPDFGDDFGDMAASASPQQSTPALLLPTFEAGDSQTTNERARSRPTRGNSSISVSVVDHQEIPKQLHSPQNASKFPPQSGVGSKFDPVKEALAGMMTGPGQRATDGDLLTGYEDTEAGAAQADDWTLKFSESKDRREEYLRFQAVNPGFHPNIDEENTSDSEIEYSSAGEEKAVCPPKQDIHIDPLFDLVNIDNISKPKKEMVPVKKTRKKKGVSLEAQRKMNEALRAEAEMKARNANSDGIGHSLEQLTLEDKVARKKRKPKLDQYGFEIVEEKPPPSGGANSFALSWDPSTPQPPLRQPQQPQRSGYYSQPQRGYGHQAPTNQADFWN